MLEALAKVLGTAIGGAGATNDVQKGKEQYAEHANQGIAELNAGKAGSDAAFSPYSAAGATGVQGQTSATQNYMGAVNPNQYKTTAAGTMDWLNPSAAYSTDQANRAFQSSALAHGAAGGGMARALANNASKLALTNWNTAASQNLAANNQNFSQNKGALDSNISNWNGLTQTGLNATNANQGNQLQYANNINQNYVGQGASAQSAQNMKGKIFSDAANSMGDTITGMFS